MIATDPIQRQALRPGRRARFQSIDEVRGVVMVFMALDHVRWFFTNISSFQPETLAQTDLALFLVRWVTHFCAPGFFLIAGIGIFIYGARISDSRSLVRYLLSRGAFLIALELTIVGYSWVFTPGYSFGGVIWSLGWAFVLMAALIHLPRPFLLALALIVLLTHNLFLNGVSSGTEGWPAFFWHMFYQPGTTALPLIGTPYYFLFPVAPWLAMMVAGYVLGAWYLEHEDERRRAFLVIGTASAIAFILLRATGIYGGTDVLFLSAETSGAFTTQPEFWRSLVSFLNTEKYPPSLQFTLMTLSPVILWLGLSRLDQRERASNIIRRAMVLFGRVPLFYYILHLYAIHLLALALAGAMGQPVGWISFGADPNASRPEGYGFDLWVIIVMWGVTIAILYFLCRWYENYKRTHDAAWLKYL